MLAAHRGNKFASYVSAFWTDFEPISHAVFVPTAEIGRLSHDELVVPFATAVKRFVITYCTTIDSYHSSTTSSDHSQ